MNTDRSKFRTCSISQHQNGGWNKGSE